MRKYLIQKEHGICQSSSKERWMNARAIVKKQEEMEMKIVIVESKDWVGENENRIPKIGSLFAAFLAKTDIFIWKINKLASN